MLFFNNTSRMNALISRVSNNVLFKATCRFRTIQLTSIHQDYGRLDSLGKRYSKRTKFIMGGIISIISIGTMTVAILEYSVRASTLLELHPPEYPWTHKRFLHGYDHLAVRRGYEVYKQVCKTCHALRYLAFRHLVGVTHTEEEMRAEASEYTIMDGPDENGEMFERPCVINDEIPGPYPNEETAQLANNGAIPPDMTLLRLAKEGNEDYIMTMLLNYCDPPAGVKLDAGQYYNPYFHGGIMGMTPPIFDGAVEYSDGTPATSSQIAKDITTFLCWTSDTHHDKRMQYAIKSVFYMVPIIIAVMFHNRHNWSSIKTRKIIFSPRKPIRRQMH